MPARPASGALFVLCTTQLLVAGVGITVGSSSSASRQQRWFQSQEESHAAAASDVSVHNDVDYFNNTEAFAWGSPVGLHHSISRAVNFGRIESEVHWLSFNISNLPNYTDGVTTIVTHAGKKNLEYIDSAILLGLSLQKHVPEYPRVCMVIDHMNTKYKRQLRHAGWTLLEVKDWDSDYCGDCNDAFMGRWKDSFEKLNTFRLPFSKVLFMDSDTYVFSRRLKDLLDLPLPEQGIAMAKDGCKHEFNSGVMLFRPTLSNFQSVLTVASMRTREDLLDQSVINEVFKGRIHPISVDFNCIDLQGVPPGVPRDQAKCEMKCEDVVVAHFTGRPKPARASHRILDMVRRPDAPKMECTDTNWGGCLKWSHYYCEMREPQSMARVSKQLKNMLFMSGRCCHKPYNPELDEESCEQCPNVLQIRSQIAEMQHPIFGFFKLSNIKPTKFHGGRPIYVRDDNTLDQGEKVYLYYCQKQTLWLVSNGYNSNAAWAYAQKDAICPRDAGSWHVHKGNGSFTTQYKIKAMDGRSNYSLLTGAAPNASSVYDAVLRGWVQRKTLEDEFQDEDVEGEDL